MAEPPGEGVQRRNETQTNPGPSTVPDRQAAATQPLPADRARYDQQMTHGSGQPSQQEPTPQPPLQLQPRPGETQTNPGSSTAATQQLPADGVRDDQQTTQSNSRQPSQQEPTPPPPPQLQPRPGETQTNPGPHHQRSLAEPPGEGVQRQNETQTNPGPSTAPDSQAALTQQLPSDGVRDDQQTTQSGSRQPSQQDPLQQPPPQLQPRPEANWDKEHPEIPGITEPVLRKISERLGSEWRKLATHLGLSAAEIEHIMMEDPGQTENQIFNMLAEWRGQQRDVLCTALVKLGKMDIAKDMIDFSDPILRKISERLCSEWRKLATHLGLSAVEIDNIMMDDPGQTENQILNMLIEWRRKQREVLCTALMEIGRTSIAEDLIGISDLDLRMIPNKLCSEWRKLAAHLGLRPATIDRIVMDDPGQTENQIFNMLVKWMRQQATSADQRDVLCTALMEIGRTDIVEDLIEAQVGGAKEQNRQRRTTSSERQGQGDVGHRDKSHQEVQERGAKEQSKLKSTSSPEGQRQNQQEAGGTHPNVQKETLQSSEEHGLKGSTDQKPAYAQEGVTPRNQSEKLETAVKEMTSQDQQLVQGPKSVQDIVPVGQTSSRSPAVLGHVPAQLVSVDSMSFSGENCPVVFGPVNQLTFVQSSNVTVKSSGSPKVSIGTDVTRKGGEDPDMTDVLWIALTNLHKNKGKDFIHEQFSDFWNSCDGELEELKSGSVTFVVRFKSREGLNKLWSMYTTGELAKKLTEILITVLITDELTTEDESDLAIKATIPESDYDLACKFFDELEKDQQKDEEDSSSMEEVQQTQLGESSTATKAYSSDPTEYAEDRCEEKVKALFRTTGISDLDLYKISVMFGSEWQKLATHLGLSAAEIDRIMMDDPGQTENQILNMLVKWRGKQAEVLYKVLMKMGRTDIVEELIGFSDLILHKISGMLGSEWRKLATHLGLSTAEIDRIVMDDPGQTQKQIFNMLVKWRHKQSTSVDQREVFFTALMEIKRTNTAEDVIDNVMRALEADANERAEKRKMRKAEATVLKDQGNQAFQKGDYTRAVELYTQGLERLKDFVVLYINRAQAYNKLEKFSEVMEDCRTALQLEPNNVKALLHLGKAQQGLKDYEAAVTTFQEILKIDEKYEKMVAGYIAAVNLAESTAKSDMEAERLFSEGDVKATGVHEIGLSDVTDSQAALTQQLPDDQQTTQSGSGQPSQQEPTQQPPPQLQPRPDYPQRSGASIGSIGTISGGHNPIIVGSSVNFRYNLPSEGPEIAGFQGPGTADNLLKELDFENKFRDWLKQIGKGNVLAMESSLRFYCSRSMQAAGLILDHIREMQGDEEELQRFARLLLLESGSENLVTKLVRPTWVNCESNKDLKPLSYYLQHVTPPLKGTVFNMHVRKQGLTLLRGILLSDSMESTRSIFVFYHLSEQEEELNLLEETLSEVDEQRCAQLHILVSIEAKSWFDVGRVSHSLFRMREQIGWLGLNMDRQSPDEVVDLLKALEGCRFSYLTLYCTNLHAGMGDVNHISSSLTSLHLIACMLVDDDVKDLISILPAGHGLASLDLSENAFSLDAVRALTHHLQGLPKLYYLFLRNIGLDAEHVRQVVSQDLPHLKEIREGIFAAYKSSTKS